MPAIGQERSKEPASKRLRQVSPRRLPVSSGLRDEHSRIDARKRDAVLWDSPILWDNRVTSTLLQGIGEHGSPSVQPHPLNALVLPVEEEEEVQ